MPRLVALAHACGWYHYGCEEWSFLIAAGCDEAWVAEDALASVAGDREYSSESIEQEAEIRGSILRVRFPCVDGSSSSAVGIGMMLVNPLTRGQGLGKELMNKAMGGCEGELIVLGAATKLGQAMYEKMGYETTGSVAMLTSDCFEVSARRTPDSETNASVEVKLFGGDCAPPYARAALAAFDRTATGLDRHRALDAALSTPGSQLAVAVNHASGEPCGAAVMFAGSIGPVVGDAASAEPLIIKLAASTDAPVAVKVNNHPQLVARLEEIGFQGPRLVEMTFGGKSLPGLRELNYHALLHPTLG